MAREVRRACHCIGTAKAIPARHRAQAAGDDDWLVVRVRSSGMLCSLARCSSGWLQAILGPALS